MCMIEHGYKNRKPILVKLNNCTPLERAKLGVLLRARIRNEQRKEDKNEVPRKEVLRISMLKCQWAGHNR